MKFWFHLWPYCRFHRVDFLMSTQCCNSKSPAWPINLQPKFQSYTPCIIFVEPQHFQYLCSRCSFANQIEKFYEPVLPSDPVPTPDSPLCAKDRKCLTLNCPWKSYPDRRYKKYKHYECKTMDKGSFSN